MQNDKEKIKNQIPRVQTSCTPYRLIILDSRYYRLGHELRRGVSMA